MQLLNRFKAVLSGKTKLYIIVGVVLLSLIASIVFLLFESSNSSNPNEYLDPGSGETVSSPKDKTPELFGVDSARITYLGFSKLIDYGFTIDQLELVKSTMQRFSTTDGRSITELSITVASIEQTITETDASFSFPLTANRAIKYSCVIKYIGLSDAQVIISDDSGKQIFDSSVN